MNIQDLIAIATQARQMLEEYRKGFPKKFVIFNIKNSVVEKKAIYGFNNPNGINGQLSGSDFIITSTSNELTYDGFALCPHRSYADITHTLSQVTINSLSDITGEFIIIWEAY